VKVRIATAIAGVSIVALLSVAAASGKPPGPPGPPINVPCTGQQALVDAARSTLPTDAITS